MFIIAFLPPAIYAIWIRNTERYHRDKWLPIMICFLWGATIAIIASLILEIIFQIPLAFSLQNNTLSILATAVIIAPFAEELTKPIILSAKVIQKEIDELEDGLIYGAVAGLGFSATENFLYGWSFLSEGLFIFFLFMTIRSIGGCLLHASATALTGYGYSKSIITKTSPLYVIPYILLAMCIHGLYNLIFSINLIGAVASLLIALLFVSITIIFIRKKIKKLDDSSK